MCRDIHCSVVNEKKKTKDNLNKCPSVGEKEIVRGIMIWSYQLGATCIDKKRCLLYS